MTASVENRQLPRPFKPTTLPPHHQPGLPVRLVKEEENEYAQAIKKGNVELEPSIYDPRDESTSDNWVKRNPAMIRLTGKHPFNAEAPLARLMHHGFITPAPLHYVRNHGPVPKASWDDWTVEVTGLVERPVRFTMHQLETEFQPKEFPATLACSGNRRKELNMVKQTIGFNWGSAGTSTSVWRGVPLRAVLKRCGVMGRKHGALHVCLEGAEDLPGGGGSNYGTSLKMEVAMDRSRDIILAYMQNGERLLPDHGFPVRMIVPGFTGGRMVKWLKRIVVTTQESDNYYHFKDNRLIPSHVDAELANAEAWFYKPESIINELNINSVITTPCHDEILPIDAWTTQRPYTLKGYSFSGGGKKVIRVEVTMDNGETWQVCKLNHPEMPNKYGKYWCWCFWSLEVEVLDLLSAKNKEVAVRAWDETFNTQPDKLIWNVMGMVNNCWFRVKTNIYKSNKGEIGIVFEHPTQPANQPGGWMAKDPLLEKPSINDKKPDPKKTVPLPPVNSNTKTLSPSEVEKHNSSDSAWIIVNGNVYDCTPFLKDHPGGADSILINAGIDCTEEFDAIHSDKAKKLLEDYRIGELLTADNPSPIPEKMNHDQIKKNTTTVKTTLSPSEVKKHNSSESAWIIVNGHVYDCTPFLNDHPGGADSILINAGTDCTEEFEAIHSDTAKKLLEDYRIGELVTDGSYFTPISLPVPVVRSAALKPRERIKVKLVGKIYLSHDVRLLRFALPDEDQVLGLPVGKHILVCATVDGKLCMRAYTPSSDVETVGHFDLVVKVYFKGVHPKYPNGGLMSQHLDSVKLGQFVEVKGPFGQIEYTGKGSFMANGKRRFARKLGMIAGGSGITPIYQVMQAVLKDPEDETKMYLIYGNRTEDDILLRDELDTWAEKYPERVKVWYAVQESVREDWKYSLGFVTEDIMREHMPMGSGDSLALVCGSPPMLRAVSPNLEKMGYNKDSVFTF